MEKPHEISISENYQWISSSIFSEMEIWPLVLKEMSDFLKKNEIICFRIQFNYSNGPNIRLAVLTSIEDRQLIGYKLSLRFRSFLYVFAANAPKKIIDSAFLPLPTNVIEFGLYQLHLDANSRIERETEEKISWLIMDVLTDDDIDVESIVTFSFYLQMGVIKSILNQTEISSDFTQQLSLPIMELSSLKMSHDNFTLLFEITTEIMSTEMTTGDLAWINHWIAFCESSLKEDMNQCKERPSYHQSSLITFYYKFTHQIHDLLGVSGELVRFLNYAVKRSIVEYFKL